MEKRRLARGRLAETAMWCGAVGGIVTLILSLIGAPLVAHAQQPGKVYRIGILGNAPPTVPGVASLWKAFAEGLRERGYVEGKNLVIERRWTEGRIERFPPLAAELVSLKVDLIVAVSKPAVLAVKQATRLIPIIMVNVLSPVESGLVSSFAWPGGNVTGVAFGGGLEIAGKHLELLKEVVPQVSRVAVLSSPAYLLDAGLERETQRAAVPLALLLQFYQVQNPDELEGAFTEMAKLGVNGLLVLPTPFAKIHGRRIVELAATNRLPAVYPFRESVEAGGLMAYSANAPDMFRRAASYVDKILKGAKPADLPVEQLTNFELVVNLKTAEALGLTMPQSVLIRADEVIQ
jgi:putative ABC transport system substrate-binding protein